MVNGILFDDDHLMLKNAKNKQVVTGQKRFTNLGSGAENPSESICFMDLRLKKSLNDFNITDLLQNLVRLAFLKNPHFYF